MKEYMYYTILDITLDTTFYTGSSLKHIPVQKILTNQQDSR